ncbi:MAG: ParB/RepB/Spo0J family partition protein [Gammaproteobacteria bacterium]|nr:ParB/RepB/Spo0J family partition protein [Gammaproteobacteria bacterium]
MAARKRGLGKGLDVLLGSSTSAIEGDLNKEVLRQLPIDVLQRGKYQPRQDMHSDALEDLAQSIRAQGVLQPIVVRPVANNRFEIIAGERRWRASQIAGLDTIPAVVKDVTDDAAVAMSLIENIQRENLNPIEEAAALQRLQKEFSLTQQQVAESVGKSRTTVTNLLRLMTLTESVKRMLEHGDLEMGHARALLSLTDEKQLMAARMVVAKSLSVRQTESLVSKLLDIKAVANNIPRVNPDIKTLEDSISEKLGTKVIVQANTKGKGKMTIHYNNLDELDGILAHIK